ncbi:YchJ family protein [Bacteriovoracaceae bacterium]|nr:YchJ family protein [Bacteriovoracaceae bacterium]
MSSNNCPCGREKTYEDCCELIHNDVSNAKTAEDLMRSRYSAFVKNKVDFIVNTHLDEGQETSRESIEQWSKNSKWLGLEVVSTEKGLESDETGKVEFIANYESNEQDVQHHELAEFKKVDGKWIYADGHVINQGPYVRETPKVGRNEPCPCGSEKKFKKCCGKN